MGAASWMSNTRPKRTLEGDEPWRRRHVGLMRGPTMPFLCV
jgi:hypothetical protein